MSNPFSYTADEELEDDEEDERFLHNPKVWTHIYVFNDSSSSFSSLPIYHAVGPVTCGRLQLWGQGGIAPSKRNMLAKMCNGEEVKVFAKVELGKNVTILGCNVPQS